MSIAFVISYTSSQKQAIKFWGSQVIHEFDCAGVSAPNPSIVQGSTVLYDFTYMKYARVVKFIGTEGRMVVARGWGEGKMSYLMGRVCFPR